jgi:hypothetical protein
LACLTDKEGSAGSMHACFDPVRSTTGLSCA